MNLNERYAQILGARETAEISARASGYAADRRLEGDKITAEEARRTRAQRAGETAEGKKFERLQVAQQQEGRVLNQIAAEKDKEVHKDDLKTLERYKDRDGKVIAGMEQRVADAQKRINDRNADWEKRTKTAANAVDEARRRVTGEAAPAPAAPAPAPTVESVKVGDKTYTRPAGMTDAQWSDYKKSQGVK
jgi:flagellar motility protein MotE (MotC chaperone)